MYSMTEFISDAQSVQGLLLIFTRSAATLDVYINPKQAGLFRI